MNKMFDNQNTKYYLLIAIIVFLFIFCSVVSIAGTNAPPTDSPSATGDKTSSTTVAPSTTSENGNLPGTTKEPDTQTGPVTPKDAVICIDAGHGWADKGAQATTTAPDGSIINESDINLAISRELRDFLVSLGYKVVMIRENDTDISPAGINESDNICNVNRRVEWINSQNDLSLLVSIHCDTYAGKGTARGTRIYFHTGTHPKMNSLAQLMSDHLVNDGVNGKNALIYPDSSDKFLPLKASRTQSILVECGFLTDESDTAKLIDPDYQKDFARALAKAIDDFFNA